MIFYLLLACQSTIQITKQDPVPSPPKEVPTMNEELYLIKNETVPVPQIGGYVTLLSGRHVIKKTENGKQTIHKGRIRITIGEETEEVDFIANRTFTHKNFRLRIDGIVGSFELHVQK